MTPPTTPPTTPRSPELLRADLASAEPERIRAALQELQRRRRGLDEVELPMPGLDLLQAFGAPVPKDVQWLFLDAVARYRRFGASEEQRLALMVALVLRHADGQCSFELALWIKSGRDPVSMVGAALREVQRQGLAGTRSIEGAGLLLSRLLDGRAEVRQATLDGLCAWPADAGARAVARHVEVQLAPQEAMRLRACGLLEDNGQPSGA